MGFFLFTLLPLPSKERLLGNNVGFPLVSRIEECSACAITILQGAAMLGHSPSLSHIPVTAPPSLADLWQRMRFKALDLLLIPTVLIVLIFFSCVYIRLNMPCPFCGWVSILIFIYIV
jgi:hypothetical protein